jgi:hypothetical protein
VLFAQTTFPNIMSNQSLQIVCPHCNLEMNIPLQSLPTDQKQIKGACGGCKQQLVISNPLYKETMPPPIPNVQQNLPPIPQQPKSLAQTQDDKTVIGEAIVSYTVFKLHNTTTGMDYYLQVGKNIIGKNAPITIANDPYISSIHCCIQITVGAMGAKCVLYDDGSINNGKASSNGTFKYEYGEYKRLNDYDKILLDNNTKIRVGRTELTFKML